MDETQKKRLFWQRVTAIACILLLIVVTAGVVYAVITLQRIAPHVESIVTRLDSATAQLENVDLDALSQEAGDMVAKAKTTLASADKAIERVNAAIEDLDIQNLNSAVSELLAVVEPLANFFGKFQS